MAADLEHPVSSPFLFVQLEPAEARPNLEAVIHQLAECTPFRFHNHPQSDDDTRPRLRQIEFQQLECAQKAYATIQHAQLPPSQDSSSATEPVLLSLSVHEDAALDTLPPEGTLLHVSELPTSYCSPGPLYELFKPFGPLFRIDMGPRLGTARITYYDKASSKAAEEELHYSNLDGTSIIVRSPSIHDPKDSFKSTLFPLQGRRTFSAGSLVNVQTGNCISLGVGQNEHIKRPYNYASSHRATCGVGSAPYGLSANAEPFKPGSLPGTPADDVAPSTAPHVQQVRRAPFSIRTVSQPIKLSDACQLIIQNVPLDLNAQSLYMALRNKFVSSCPLEGITLLEATIASDASTEASQGIALIRLGNKKQTDTALKVLNEGYLAGHENQDGLMPMRVKLFEPKGFIERGLQLHHLNRGSPSPSAPVNKPYNPESDSRDPSTSPSATSSSTKVSLVRDKDTKHRNLLSTALDDLDEDMSGALFTSENEKSMLLSLLIVNLPEEERKRCILEEKYLKKRCEALKVLYWDDVGDGMAEHEDAEVERKDGANYTDQLEKDGKIPVAKQAESENHSGSESPTRHYGRQELLKLYTLQSPVHEKTEGMIRAISPTTSTRPLPPASPLELRKTTALSKRFATSETRLSPREEIDLDTLVRFSVKGIIDLASSSDPPALLRGRDEATVKAVELFLDGIRELKIAQQKQKIGEKVFKLFKSRAAGMKNISKKTVILLDREDLDALMHLTEGYPEILVHKAMCMEV